MSRKDRERARELAAEQADQAEAVATATATGGKPRFKLAQSTVIAALRGLRLQEVEHADPSALAPRVSYAIKTAVALEGHTLNGEVGAFETAFTKAFSRVRRDLQGALSDRTGDATTRERSVNAALSQAADVLVGEFNAEMATHTEAAEEGEDGVQVVVFEVDVAKLKAAGKPQEERINPFGLRDEVLATLATTEAALLASCNGRAGEAQGAVRQLRQEIMSMGKSVTPKAKGTLESKIDKLKRRFGLKE